MSKFIALEGLDGCGKTNLASFICEELTQQGFDVIRTREPGGTVLAEQTRNMHLTNDNISDRTRFILINAGRSDHMEKVVIPAIQNGKVVVSERSIFSGYAYQIHDLIEPEFFDNVVTVLGDTVIPFKTFYIRISYETSLKRMEDRKKDVIEQKGEAFFNRAILGYEDLLTSRYGNDIIVIDGEQPLEKVKADIRKELLDLIKQL